MNIYMDCFDELLYAAKKKLPEEEIKNILNDDKMRHCFEHNTFCSDFISLCIAVNYDAGINAARDIIDMDGISGGGSISFFLPLLSGRRPEAALLSCSDLAENLCGVGAGVLSCDRMLGYNSMLYMFIAGDCYEALEKFLDRYMLMGVPDNSLSEYIRIAAKHGKTGMLRLFADRGFTVTEEDTDDTYAGSLMESAGVAVHTESREADCGKVQIMRNWTVEADTDRITFSGNVYSTGSSLPDARFYSFEADCCMKLSDTEFIVSEKGSDNNSYILRFDEEIKKDRGSSVLMEEIFTFCKNNTADNEGLAELLLSEGEALSVPGIGYAGRMLRKGEAAGDNLRCIYYLNAEEKTLTRSVMSEKKDVPSFRMSGRDFYKCFDMLTEVIGCIMKDQDPCTYIGMIGTMLRSEIGIREKDSITELIFTCLRYYACGENYRETAEVLKEYGLCHRSILCRSCVDRIFDFLNADSPEARKAAYRRIMFRPDINVFAAVPFIAAGIVGAMDNTPGTGHFRPEDAGKTVCWLAEKRDWSAVSVLSRMGCRIKDMDMLELALRSPGSVYDFMQNNFYGLVPDRLKKDGAVKSIDELIRTLACFDHSDTDHFAMLSEAYMFFDREDFEFIVSRMSEIKYISERDLAAVYRNEINYCRCAYGSKPEIARYYDRLFSKNVHIAGSSFSVYPAIKKELRSKLTRHRFIVTVYHLTETVLGLPKNFELELSRSVDTEDFIRELVRNENSSMIVAAARHGIISNLNIGSTVRYAVENCCYRSLKTLYRIIETVQM